MSHIGFILVDIMSHTQVGDSDLEISLRCIRNATTDIVKALDTKVHYAIVGGAACVLLGGKRTTTDVDPKINLG